jgi:uncharacterized protein RhaS with RHS repeats
MVYNRFRYYSSALGRYLSADPLQIIYYSYAAGNPLVFTDPYALDANSDIAALVAADEARRAQTQQYCGNVLNAAKSMQSPVPPVIPGWGIAYYFYKLLSFLGVASATPRPPPPPQPQCCSTGG